MERYIAWKPQEFREADLDVISVIFDAQGLRILLQPEGRSSNSVELEFSFPRAYCGIDEGYRLATFGDREFDGQSTVYRVENSEFLERFRKESLGTMDDFPLVHWFIASENECVDVLSENEPKIKRKAGTEIAP